MPLSLSLLDELRKGGYEASLITTFNAYLPFYEEVVLRRLVNAGVRHNVLMMDARQYGVSFRNYPPRLAGRRYTLMPVDVPGAFHPKLIFLAGKNKGLIAIGSHNMTLAGFGFNRELTNVVRIQGSDDRAGKTIAIQVWEEVQHWLKTGSQEVPEQVANMVLRVKDFAPWLNTQAPDSASDVRVLAGRPGAKPLWVQLTDLLEGRAIDVLVAGAFFDSQLRFLKHVQQDLQPDRLVVAVDPKTVQMPPAARTASDMTLVRADNLGANENKEGEASRYLHAKALLVQLEHGKSVFVSGSANPSAPAWLATDDRGNVELMLARLGDSARTAVEETGFADVAGAPSLNSSDWTAIQDNQQEDREDETPQVRIGVAVVEDNQVLLSKELVADLEALDLVLLGRNRQEITRSTRFRIQDDLCVAEFPAAQLVDATSLRWVVAGELKAEFLLHHAYVVKEQARTSVQKRFKEALLSLGTDTPNIGLLIECIDKIVFSTESTRESVTRRVVRPRDERMDTGVQEQQSLAIDVSETKKRKTKQRLGHTGDFAYLLDALIYHLRFQEDKIIEEVDRYGRSEEEQVGADDEEDTETAQLAEKQRIELLELCHSKVRTVINRMVTQLRAYGEEKQSLENVLVRLLAVLAVLRELRGCDGRVAWVAKGKTTVPPEQRFRLLEEVMLTLFEGRTSLLHLESLGEDFKHSDDVARLKGLLLWLAWDCRLALDLQKPFMESPEELKDRLRRNAMLLALAQTIRTDDVVIDEARQSIGVLTSSDLDWLKELQVLAAQCDAMNPNSSECQSSQEAQPGDIAIHKSMKNWDLRVVASRSGRNVSLIRLSKDKERNTYRSKYLRVIRLHSMLGSGRPTSEVR